MTNAIEQTPLVEGRDEDDSARILAIKEAADCTLDEAETFFDEGDWYAYTDDEADEKCQERIKESLWAFNASFIVNSSAGYGDLTAEETAAAIKAIEAAQQTQCESLNGLIYLIIGGEEGLADFTTDAIRADGRGHFLSQYDGDEYEATINGTTYYCYRAN